MRRDQLGFDLVEIERRGIEHARAGRRQRDDLGRDQRSGVQADRTARDQISAAHRDQVGGAGTGADEVHGHRFTILHCITAIAGRRRCSDPSGAALSKEKRQSSPPRRSYHSISRACVSIATALTTSRPPVAERLVAVLDHARLASSAADEYGVGRRQLAEPRGRARFEHFERGNPERGRVLFDPRAALGILLHGDRAAGDVAQHPFDADRARARSDVPEQLPGARRQCGQADRPQVLLGQLPVVLERRVRQTGATRQDQRRSIGDRLEPDQVEVFDVAQIEVRGARAAQPLLRSAERFEHV